MIGLRASRKDAEKARRFLAKHALLDNHYKIYGDNSFIYLPVVPNTEDKKVKSAAEKLGAKVVRASFEGAENPSAYRQLLKKKLGDRYGEVTKSYDIVGNIALIDVKGKAALQTAKAIMETNKNVETVISKDSAVGGKYRTRKYRHVLGKKNFVATYRENGVVLRFDIRKTFFSSRLAFDRLRIARLVKKGENVIVMFAGMGPFAIEIGKMQKDSNVVGIELNRSAYSYMKRNIALNKATNVTAELGDVKKVANRYKHFANRVVMPLPTDAFSFLGAVVKVARKGCVVHYYAFGERKSAFEQNTKKVKEFFLRHNRKIRILDKRVVRQYSPKQVEIVLDILLR
ncbi:MAG: class I SAM-dependent methyltransferase family protein [Candidatus Micrarchaeota archaeon]|nr:class I SAM-dependent methyltransferase family protein [Candidatus Micrarchaeota archaeon]